MIRSAFYAAVRPLTLAALGVVFRRVRRRGTIPREGPVLLVANHPAAWADVVALVALLGRPLHFLAHTSQFRPWARAILLRMWGTLPVYESEGGVPDHRNDETFRRCEALLGQGEVVAIFPEGVSRLDRGLMPLRLGAARLALAFTARSRGRPLALIPAGLHYSDRTAAGSELTLSTGAPIRVPRLSTFDLSVLETEAARLTERVQHSMRSLVVDVPDLRRAALLRILEPIVARNRDVPDLEEARTLARALATLAEERPGDLAALERAAAEWERARSALGVSPRALARPAMRGRAQRVASWAVLVLGAAPALGGALLRLVPDLLGNASAAHYGSEPQRVTFARMVVGLASWVLVGTVAGVAARSFGANGLESAGIGAAALTLALVAREYAAWIRPRFERVRLALLERSRPDLVRGARLAYDNLRPSMLDLETVPVARGGAEHRP